MIPVPSNLIPQCCKPTQQPAYPNSCSRFPTLMATCWTWAWALSLQRNHLDTAASPEAPSASSYFDQLWSTVSKKPPST